MKYRCLDDSKVVDSITKGNVYEGVPPPHYNLSDTIWIVNDKGTVVGHFRTRFEEIQNEDKQEELALSSV